MTLRYSHLGFVIERDVVPGTSTTRPIPSRDRAPGAPLVLGNVLRAPT